MQFYFTNYYNRLYTVGSDETTSLRLECWGFRQKSGVDFTRGKKEKLGYELLWPSVTLHKQVYTYLE